MFGWGSGFDNEILLPQVLFDYNHAGVKMLDRLVLDCCMIHTGWPKSNVPKVRAYCSASDHLIRKMLSDVCWDRFH